MSPLKGQADGAAAAGEEEEEEAEGEDGDDGDGCAAAAGLQCIQPTGALSTKHVKRSRLITLINTK